MTREEYMAKLQKYLRKLPKQDYEDAIEYFNEYFSDTDEEGQQKLMEELGTPKEAAADLMCNLLDRKLQEQDTDIEEKKSKKGIITLSVLAILSTPVTVPDDVDRGWFMFFVNLLNQIYWVSAATAGALLGYMVQFDTTGIDFVMTALFVVMFLNQWEEAKDHRPALVGLICSAVCLLIFGSSNFIVPSMIFIIICFTAERKLSKKPEVAAK